MNKKKNNKETRTKTTKIYLGEDGIIHVSCFSGVEIDLDEAKKKARNFHKLFTSPIGEKVLRDLEQELNPDTLIASTPHETSYNVGRRDAFIYIQQLIRYSENARRAELEG